MAKKKADGKVTKKNPVGNPNLAEEGKPYRWQKGMSGNPDGRPPDMLKQLMKRANVEFNVELTKKDKYRILESMMEMSVNQLMKLGKDKDCPIFMAGIAKAMYTDFNNGKTPMLDKLFDRFFGRAAQPLTHGVDPDLPAGTTAVKFVVMPDNGRGNPRKKKKK